MKDLISIVLVEDSLTYQSKRCDKTHMEPQESVVERIVAAEPAQNKVHQKNE